VIWQQPWAWLGLVAVAVPVLVHLLARRHAVRVPFPTLRFLPTAHSSSIRRHRLSDVALMCLRMLIVAAAVAGLAQPFVVTSTRTRDLGSSVSRAVIVDSSASMLRRSDGGRDALTAARERARTLAGEAARATVIEGPRLAPALAGAAAWLARAPGLREIAIVSDFQSGAIDSTDLAGLPEDIGLSLVKIAAAPPSAVTLPPLTIGPNEVQTRVAMDSTRSDIEWHASPAVRSQASGLRIVAGDEERTRVEAALEAARAVTAVALSDSHQITVVFPGAPERDALLTASAPIDQPWMVEVARRAGLRGTPARRSRDGALMLFPATSDGITAAALLADAVGAPPDVQTLAELEPETVPQALLTQWERPATPPAAPRAGPRAGESDGRWLWGLALVLLGIEAVVRRRTRQPVAAPFTPPQTGPPQNVLPIDLAPGERGRVA
jgi:hypothetical protein